MRTVDSDVLARVCGEGASRLMQDVHRRYDVATVEPLVVPVTPREIGQVDDRYTVWNFLVIGSPAGDFVVERDLDGGLRLPTVAWRPRRLWTWSDWPFLLQHLHDTVHGGFGLELLAPEPVATFPITFASVSQSRRIDALVWLAQYSGKLKPRRGLTATVVNHPAQLDLQHDQLLATVALQMLARRPRFPLAELDAAAAEANPGVSRHAKRLVRAVLRLAPQPQRDWLFSQLKELGAGPGTRVLDLACGDDDLASQIRTTFGAHVAVNDVLLKNAVANVHRHPQLELYNHDVRSFPVTLPFDVVILKNLLHHLRAAEDHAQLLSVLSRISRTALIVEIADPSASRFHSWLHKWIYTDDPDADGHAFLDLEVLSHVLGRTQDSVEAPTRVEQVSTLRGNYLLARLDFNPTQSP